MKKLSIILVICVMISSLAFSANAATMDQKSQEQTVCVESINSDNQSVQKELAAAFEQAHLEDVQAAQAYAYLDLESASEEMKEKILEARNTIIFSQGWVADGGYAYIGRADGTIEVLPQFSDLFPGWDIPIEEPRTVEEISAILATQSDLTEFTYNNWTLNNPSSSVNTKPFYVFLGNTRVTTFVNSLQISTSCNIGYSDILTGRSLVSASYLCANEFIYCNLDYFYREPAYVGVRASTYSTPGTGSFTIIYD